MEGSSVGNTSQFPVADKVLESGVDRAETWPERRAESTFVRLETIADRLASPAEISPDKAVFRLWFSGGKGLDKSTENRVVPRFVTSFPVG